MRNLVLSHVLTGTPGQSVVTVRRKFDQTLELILEFFSVRRVLRDRSVFTCTRESACLVFSDKLFCI